MRTLLRRWSRVALGVLTGSLTALVELPFVLVGGLWLLVTLVQRVGWAAGANLGSPVYGGAHRLVAVERRRLASFYGLELAVPPAGGSALSYLALRCCLGLLGSVVLLVLLLSAGYASLLLWGWFLVGSLVHPDDVLLSVLAGLLLFFLCVQGVYGVGLMDQQLARHYLGPSDRELLERRIGELAASRAGIVAAVHDERRRIERDLHDGMQQRLVALGMLLGRARRSGDQEKAARLLDQAHRESQQALSELREVAWRIYPASLDEGGLAVALEAVAERSGVPVQLAGQVPENLGPVVQTVAYFVVAEAVTNAAKHSGATRVTVHLERQGNMVKVRIEDDGSGGADPTGGGLLGLARRVAALDGQLTVDSPVGGPTLITAELPCG